MSNFSLSVLWERTTPTFEQKSYDRTHKITFSGGTEIQASSAPEYNGRADLVNPEESLLASLASCHMLTFLAIAANSKLMVDRYEEQASATLEKDDHGKLFVKNILLQPKVFFADNQNPGLELLNRLHEKAHANCIIARSIRSSVKIEPRS